MQDSGCGDAAGDERADGRRRRVLRHHPRPLFHDPAADRDQRAGCRELPRLGAHGQSFRGVCRSKPRGTEPGVPLLHPAAAGLSFLFGVTGGMRGRRGDISDARARIAESFLHRASGRERSVRLRNDSRCTGSSTTAPTSITATRPIQQIKAQMISQGYIAEGYGPSATIMCAPQSMSLAEFVFALSRSHRPISRLSRIASSPHRFAHSLQRHDSPIVA